MQPHTPARPGSGFAAPLPPPSGSSAHPDASYAYGHAPPAQQAVQVPPFGSQASGSPAQSPFTAAQSASHGAAAGRLPAASPVPVRGGGGERGATRGGLGRGRGGGGGMVRLSGATSAGSTNTGGLGAGRAPLGRLDENAERTSSDRVAQLESDITLVSKDRAALADRVDELEHVRDRQAEALRDEKEQRQLLVDRLAATELRVAEMEKHQLTFEHCMTTVEATVRELQAARDEVSEDEAVEGEGARAAKRPRTSTPRRKRAPPREAAKPGRFVGVIDADARNLARTSFDLARGMTAEDNARRDNLHQPRDRHPVSGQPLPRFDYEATISAPINREAVAVAAAAARAEAHRFRTSFSGAEWEENAAAYLALAFEGLRRRFREQKQTPEVQAAKARAGRRNERKRRKAEKRQRDVALLAEEKRLEWEQSGRPDSVDTLTSMMLALQTTELQEWCAKEYASSELSEAPDEDSDVEYDSTTADGEGGHARVRRSAQRSVEMTTLIEGVDEYANAKLAAVAGKKKGGANPKHQLRRWWRAELEDAPIAVGGFWRQMTASAALVALDGGSTTQYRFTLDASGRQHGEEEEYAAAGFRRAAEQAQAIAAEENAREEAEGLDVGMLGDEQ